MRRPAPDVIAFCVHLSWYCSDPREDMPMRQADIVDPLVQDRRQFMKAGGAATAALLAQGALPGPAEALPGLPSNPATAGMPTRNGCDSVAQLEENVKLAREFTPLTEARMAALAEAAMPCSKQALFFRFFDRA
jgi:hypothetical protein